MIIASVSISLGGNVVLFLLSALLLAGAAALFYRYTLPPLPPRRRLLLSILRALALALLLLILFEPILRLLKQEQQQPVIAVLADNSQSMTIKDAGGDRAAELRALVGSKQFSSFPFGAVVKYFPFSSKLEPEMNMSRDTLPLKGEVTNLSEIFAGLKTELKKENIQAAVLMTDGNYTTGKNPLYDAEALGIPLYTVGIGDTTDQKDILVEKIVTNTIAYTETQVPVDVSIKSSGFNGEKAEVVVSDGSTVIDRAMLTMLAGVQHYSVKMHVEPKEEGTKKYTVSVSKLPGELTDRNNTRSVFIKVLKSKLNVLIIAGAPNPDVSAVRQTLIEDQHLTVRALVQKNINQFYEGTFSKTTLDSADCIILIGFPSSTTSNNVIEELRDVVSQKLKPVLFINGRTTDYTKLQLLEPLLPFSISAPGTGEVFVVCSIPEKEKQHPLITLEGNMTADAWQQLPPIYRSQTSLKAKPGSEALAFAVLQNIVLNEPLVVMRNINRQKSFAITGEGVWRWRLLAQGSAQTEHFLPLLISNAVRWLTTKEDDKRVRVVPVKETFTTAEPVEFTGQVYDDELRPVDNAQVIVKLQHGKEQTEIALNAVGNGMYEGSLDAPGEGEYTFTGNASRDGRSFGEDKGKFTVGQMNVEFLETKMNKQLLEQIAYRTGAKYYDARDAENLGRDLAADVHFTPKELTQASEIELWNWKYLAAMVILLFAVEWFMRKRSGML